MANILRIKRRAVGGAAGPPATLKSAEIAFNEQDNTLYYGKGDSGGNATSVIAIAGDTTAIPDCGRLSVSAGTTASFKPFNGDKIKIQGKLYSIPSLGLSANRTSCFVDSVGGQALVAGGTYLVALFDSGGTPTFDFLTTLTHSPDITAGNIGVETSSGNRSRTVIGMVYCTTNADFVDTPAMRGTLNWFNRRDIPLLGSGAGGAITTSSTPVEITGTARAYFLTWADEGVIASVSGSILSGAVGSAGAQVGYNGAAVGSITNVTIGNASWWGPVTAVTAFNVTEGLKYITPMGTGNGVSMAHHTQISGIIRG
jgi:hypothetical protein